MTHDIWLTIRRCTQWRGWPSIGRGMEQFAGVMVQALMLSVGIIMVILGVLAHFVQGPPRS